jgi:hypothetical protein
MFVGKRADRTCNDIWRWPTSQYTTAQCFAAEGGKVSKERISGMMLAKVQGGQGRAGPRTGQ